MKIHKEIYRKLYRLIPNLDEIPIQKEPYFLEKEGELPVNIHVLERNTRETVVNLSVYPYDEHRQVVPSPDAEIVLNRSKEEAETRVYIDCTGRTDLSVSINPKGYHPIN